MFTVTVGESSVRVADKADAMTLVNILFGLDCDERISFKPLTMKDQEGEEADD
jgi:hypothetical protein